MTNKELIELVLAQTTSPTLKDAMSYDEQSGLIDLEGGTPSLATKLTDVELNEFLNNLVNLVVTTRVFGTLEGWDSGLGQFFRTGIQYGDIEEWFAVNIINAEDYDLTQPSKLLEIKKADIDTSFISTTDRKLWRVTVSIQLMRSAFLNENGLEDLIAKIIGQLQMSRDYYIYTNALTDFETIEQTAEITPITSVGDSANAKAGYEEILTLANQLALPSTSYNPKQIMSVTNRGNAILVLRPEYKSAYDVNVNASLLNSDKINLSNYFKDILVMGITEEDTIGYILDRDKYIIVNRINETTSFWNPYTLTTTYFYHNWLKRAVNPLVNGVKLIKKSSS